MVPSPAQSLTSAQFSALFVNYTGDMSGDYHPPGGAVAIDAGTTTCAVGVSGCVPLTDFEGVSRPQGAAGDIGAYEWHSCDETARGALRPGAPGAAGPQPVARADRAAHL